VGIARLMLLLTNDCPLVVPEALQAFQNLCTLSDNVYMTYLVHRDRTLGERQQKGLGLQSELVLMALGYRDRGKGRVRSNDGGLGIDGER